MIWTTTCGTSRPCGTDVYKRQVYIRAATLPAGQNRYFVLAKIRNSDDAISLATCETMDEANEVLKDAVKKIQEETEED